MLRAHSPLPGALKTLDVDIRVMIPYYKVVKMGRNKKTKIGVCEFSYAGKKNKVEIWETIHPYTKVTSYFLKNKKSLDKVTSMETWGFFDKAVVEIVKNNILNWKPNIIHVNDQHCGLIPLLVKNEKLPVKTMLTIHNLAYQGKTSVDIVKQMEINPSLCKTLQWEIIRLPSHLSSGKEVWFAEKFSQFYFYLLKNFFIFVFKIFNLKQKLFLIFNIPKILLI